MTASVVWPSSTIDELDDCADLWLIPVSSPPSPDWVAHNRRLLSPTELQRYRRYLRSADAELFLSAHIAVRRILSNYAPLDPIDWRFTAGPHGRPEIRNAEAPTALRFNLSHTASMVAVLVHGTKPCGVDVEHSGRVEDPLAMMGTVFADSECEAIMALDAHQQEDAFYRLWTLKEAFIKATGNGLATGLKRFWFRGFEREGAVEFGCLDEVDPQPEAWSFTVGSASTVHTVATACRDGQHQLRSVRRIEAPLHTL